MQAARGTTASCRNTFSRQPQRTRAHTIDCTSRPLRRRDPCTIFLARPELKKCTGKPCTCVQRVLPGSGMQPSCRRIGRGHHWDCPLSSVLLVAAPPGSRSGTGSDGRDVMGFEPAAKEHWARRARWVAPREPLLHLECSELSRRAAIKIAVLPLSGKMQASLVITKRCNQGTHFRSVPGSRRSGPQFNHHWRTLTGQYPLLPKRKRRKKRLTAEESDRRPQTWMPWQPWSLCTWR